MWRFKPEFRTVKIVLRKQGVIITDKALMANQALADIILNDAVTNANYGHNLEWVGANPPSKKAVPKKEELEIDVNIKKKPTSLTSQNPPTDGLSSKDSASQDPSQSDGSKPSKRAKKKSSQQKSTGAY